MNLKQHQLEELKKRAAAEIERLKTRQAAVVNA
jgi:hypothetical protein